MYEIGKVKKTYNPFTHKMGLEAIVKFDDGRCFLGNLIDTPDQGIELMVFSSTEEGKVTSCRSYYTEWPQDVSEETLMHHLEKFAQQFENLKREIAKNSGAV